MLKLLNDIVSDPVINKGVKYSYKTEMTQGSFKLIREQDNKLITHMEGHITPMVIMKEYFMLFKYNKI